MLSDIYVVALAGLSLTLSACGVLQAGDSPFPPRKVTLGNPNPSIVVEGLGMSYQEGSKIVVRIKLTNESDVAHEYADFRGTAQMGLVGMHDDTTIDLGRVATEDAEDTITVEDARRKVVLKPRESIEMTLVAPAVAWRKCCIAINFASTYGSAYLPVTITPSSVRPPTSITDWRDVSLGVAILQLEKIRSNAASFFKSVLTDLANRSLTRLDRADIVKALLLEELRDVPGSESLPVKIQKLRLYLNEIFEEAQKEADVAKRMEAEKRLLKKMNEDHAKAIQRDEADAAPKSSEAHPPPTSTEQSESKEDMEQEKKGKGK